LGLTPARHVSGRETLRTNTNNTPHLRVSHHEARIFRATHQGTPCLDEEDRNPQEAMHHRAMLEMLQQSALVRTAA